MKLTRRKLAAVAGIRHCRWPRQQAANPPPRAGRRSDRPPAIACKANAAALAASPHSPWPPNRPSSSRPEEHAMAAIGTDIFFATIAELNAAPQSQGILRRGTGARLLRPAGAARPALQRAGACRSRRRPCARPRRSIRTSSADAYARPAAGHSVRRQGSARLRRAAHHLGREALRRPGVRLQRHGHRQALRRGRRAHRQALHGGTGRRRRLPLPVRLAHRPRPESVGPHALVRRLVQRIGRRRRRRTGAVRHRLGDFGLHRHAGVLLRRHRRCAPPTDW